MYLTAPTSTSIKPARPGVDFVESRGAVLFEVGQQRAQLAVEILPALADSDALTQRAFAVQLEASMNASTAIRASTEIIVASPSKSTNVVPASTVSTSFIAVWILAAAGLVLFVAYLLRVRHCCLPRRGRAFEYKLVLLPRRNSGISEDFRVSIGDSSPKKSSKRRTPCRVSSFKGGKAFIERCGSDHVVPQVEGMDKQKQEEPLKDDYDGEAERDLRNHLASIQSPSPRKIAIDMYWQCRSDSTPG